MTTVYHGSVGVVRHPDVERGRDGLDFGKGFYLTRLKSQAERWAEVVYSRYGEGRPTVNAYTLDEETIRESGFRILTFEAYDESWLNFIAGSRTGLKPWMGYDLIEGGVANDRVIDTVEGYINGDFAADVAIGRLKHHKPNNQIAILNQTIIDRHLVWISAEDVKMYSE